VIIALKVVIQNDRGLRGCNTAVLFFENVEEIVNPFVFSFSHVIFMCPL